MFALLLTLLGCDPTRGACETYYENVCSTCALSDYDKVQCKCLEEGTIEGGDFPSGYDITDDNAATMCAKWQAEVTYPSDDVAAECLQANEVFAEHPDNTCDVLGLNTGSADTGD